jgi:rhamnose utilization protein RhaD (predicted bifunctional aldolase and dehydrogenase)/NAD(P)-dependent dehydrogenase (short-subunit alcohol dehydrogenase family)
VIELDEIDFRVESARKLGNDSELVLHGGGNASVKVLETDHAGRIIKILRVKGSGSDMATIDRRGFTGVRMEDLLHARTIEEMSDEEMMSYLRKSMINSSEPSPSVETFLHAFIPYTYVDHSHSDHILMLTNSNLKNEDIKAILGNVIILDYYPPGFKLAKKVLDIVNKITPDVDGIVLSKHGLFTFGETADESYEKHIKIVNRARQYISKTIKQPLFSEKFKRNESAYEELPEIRGLVSKNYKKILLVDRSDEAIRIACSEEGEIFRESGPATPDMLIRTKYDYLYLTGKEDISKEVEEYSQKYEKEYKMYIKEFPMHDPFPSIILIRGFGIITAARTYRECSIIRDQFVHSMRVNSVAEKLGKHSFISRKEAFDMEYWPLEEAKLKKFKPRKLEGTVSIVTGAANGIGLEAFRKLAENGSNVVGVDKEKSVIDIARSISNEFGTETLGYEIDLTDTERVREMIRDIRDKYGGVDVVFHNAGVLKSEYIEDIQLDTLMLHFNINSLAPFIISQEVFKIMKKQGIGGNFVFNITKNLTNPGPGMISYGTTKAFSAQLSHYIAKEGGKFGIRSNIINPDKIFKNSKIWENGVLEARAKAKGITADEYKKGNLLRKEVLPEHVANMLIAMLDEDTFGATTDSMVPVDGGIL